MYIGIKISYISTIELSRPELIIYIQYLRNSMLVDESILINKRYMDAISITANEIRV